MFRLLRRDPFSEPLSELEEELLYQTTLEHVDAEFKARAGASVVTGDTPLE